LVARATARYARLPDAPDAKEMQGVPDKFEKFFNPNPGTGS